MANTTNPDRRIVTLFATFVIVVLGIEAVAAAVLDDHYYSFRAWELVKNREADAPSPFKENATYHGDAVFGDLANMLAVRRFKQVRSQTFSTDANGYRFVPQRADHATDHPAGQSMRIVAIGDSDMTGSSLSDHQTFPAKLADLLQEPVYNYSPRSPVDFLQDQRMRQHPPKVIIWEQIERTILATAVASNTTGADGVPTNEAGSMAPEALVPGNLATSAIDALDRRLFCRHHLRWWFNSATWDYLHPGYLHASGVGYASPTTSMLFFRPALQVLQRSPEERGIDKLVTDIATVHHICQSLGITLVYLPLPDKENIYQDQLPAHLRAPPQAAVFLEELGSRLDALGVLNVKLYSAFHKHQGPDLLYFRDDTHWNENGTALAARVASDIVKQALQAK